MGGFGSGKSGYRTIVEDCIRLDINFLQREGLLDRYYGTLGWTHLLSDEIARTVEYSIDYDKTKLTLSYMTIYADKEYHIKEDFWLTTTKTNFNGQRLWILCPQCMRQCGKVYLPPNGCRLCYNLIYDSCNVSRIGLFELLVKRYQKMMKNKYLRKLMSEEVL
jgi:hypothetical protein